MSLCLVFKNLWCKSDTAQLKQAALVAKGERVLDAVGWFGVWVKEADTFKFMQISATISRVLHGKEPLDCIGKTDYEVLLECGVKMSEEQFDEVCRGSDRYVFDAGSTRIFTFIEILNDTFIGEKEVWLTRKQVVELNGKKYIYGHAERLTVTKGGIDGAMKWFRMQKRKLEQINENLYVYKS